MIKKQGGFSEANIGKGRGSAKIFNLKMFNGFLVLAIIALGVYYFAGVNDLTVKGFKLQEAKKTANFLSEENKGIELRVTALESINNLSERAKSLKLVAAGNIDYLTVKSEVVAKK